jgi:hypothetical protein
MHSRIVLLRECCGREKEGKQEQQGICFTHGSPILFYLKVDDGSQISHGVRLG